VCGKSGWFIKVQRYHSLHTAQAETRITLKLSFYRPGHWIRKELEKITGLCPKKGTTRALARVVRSYLRFFGGIRSVMVPSNISAAKFTVSLSVGCGWMV